MARLFIGVFIGLALGLGLGFALFSAQLDGPLPELSLERNAPVVHAAAPAAAAEQLVAAEPSASDPSRELAPPASTAAVVPERELQGLLARVRPEAPPRPQGESAIWGQVADAQGTGIPGVTVRAELSSATDTGSSTDTVGISAPDQSLEESVREAAERHVASRANTFETTTDASGQFRLEHLTEDSFLVRAYKLDLKITTQGDLSPIVPSGSELSFLARPVISFAVTVSTPSGERAQQATIVARGENPSGRTETIRHAWTPADRVLRLPTGEFEVMALGAVFRAQGPRDQESAEQRSQTVEVDARPGAAGQTIDLQLDGRSGVRGRIIFAADNVAASGTMVRIMPTGENPAADLVNLSNCDVYAALGGGGEYSFLDLEPGKYLVGVIRNWNGPVAIHQVVHVTDTIERCDLLVPPLDPKDYLLTLVTGPDGETLRDVEFSFRHKGGNGSSSSSGMRPMRGQHGRYYIVVPENAHASYYSADVSPSEEFTLRAAHDEHGKKTITLNAGQREATIQLANPARLKVIVGGYANSGFEGRVAMRVEPRESDNNFYDRNARQPLAPDGVQSFDALAAGAYSLSLTVSGEGERVDSYRALTVATLDVDVSAGDNTVRLAFPTLYTLDVVVPGGEAETSVSLYSAEETNAGARQRSRESCDASGRVHFDRLPAGPYKLSVRGGSLSGSMAIDVPTSEVTFAADKK